MNLTVLATVAAIVFVAELPDKTALAGLVLAARYRGSWVFVGVAAAYAVHAALAVGVGSLLTLLPRRPLEAVVAAVFLLGAILLLRGRHDEPTAPTNATPHGFLRVAGTSFAVILVAEFGDLTQILTANLAARYADPLAVGLGATLGLWAAGGLAVLGSQGLLRLVPIRLISRGAALIMLVLATISLISAIRG